MKLKLRHLQVFNAVMEEGSVSAAAERLHLTQPAVSLALTSLENLLGLQLFERSRGILKPRPEAEILAVDAETSLMSIEQFANRANSIAKGDAGLIRIGSIGVAAYCLFPELIAEFSNCHQRVNIDFVVRSSSRLSHLVGNGQLDIALIESPAIFKNIRTDHFSVPCVCIMSEDDPLASEQQITPKMLRDRLLVGVQDGNPFDRKIKEAFALEGLEYETRIKGFFFAIVRRLVAEGMGVAIVDALNGCQNINDGVTWRPFVPSIDYQMSVITPKNIAQQSLAREFKDYLFRHLNKAGAIAE